MKHPKQVWIDIEQKDVEAYLRNCPVSERADFLAQLANSLYAAGMSDLFTVAPEKFEKVVGSCRLLIQRAEQVERDSAAKRPHPCPQCRPL